MREYLMPKLLLLLLLISCIKEAETLSKCQFSTDGINGFSRFDDYLKNYNICQDKLNDSLVRFQLKEGEIDLKLCFIPTFTGEGTNKSIYIGEPRCLFISDPLKVYEINFLKNRPTPEGEVSYSKFPINGVMIIKDKLIDFGAPFESPLPAPNAYLKCAEALDKTGDDSFCEVFKEMGYYSFLTF